MLERFFEFAKVQCGSPLKLPDALAIHPGCAVVLGYLIPRRFERLGSIHFVYQAEPFTSFDAVTQRRQHTLVPHRGFDPRPVSSVVLCALFSACAHCRRFAFALPLCGTHPSTFLPPVPRRCFATSASRGLAFGLGRCGTMKALTPAPLHPRCRSPRLPRHTFLPFRLQPRGLPGHRLTPRQRDQRFSDFAMNEQARRSSPPNRVRHPTDRQFASGCSPPRLAATQLPLATELWHSPARTFTVLMWRPHGRTHSRERGNPGFFRIAWIPGRASYRQRARNDV